MINIIEDRRLIIEDVPEQSIVLVPTAAAFDPKCSGLIQSINRQYPKFFGEFRNHVGLFIGHERELLGSYMHYTANEDGKMFVPVFSKLGKFSDFDRYAFREALGKICRQVQRRNRRSHENWQLHIQLQTDSDFYDDALETLDKMFFNSPIELTVYTV